MRSSKTHYLPDSVDFYSTNNSESLASDLCQSIGKILTEAIRKMTSLPAKRLGLTNRGRLTPGYAADLVILNSSK